MTTRKVCNVVNCEKYVDKRKDVCEMHYIRFRRNGNYYNRKVTTKPIEFYVDNNGCFIVTSHTALSTGYFLITKSHIRKSMHRLIYEECFGEIEKGLVVRHECDVRGCINPEHLKVGTQRDNVMDAVKRNRTLKGMDHPMRKLNDATVIEIKKMLFKGWRNCDISRKLKIHKSTICNIKHGKSWTHIKYRDGQTTQVKEGSG